MTKIDYSLTLEQLLASKHHKLHDLTSHGSLGLVINKQKTKKK